MTALKQELVGRHKRLAFMEVEKGGAKVLERMTGFTAFNEAKEAIEYSRRYVDEATERTDVVGYSTGIEYEFDRHTNAAVHEQIAAITDNEQIGKDAQVNIVVVDIFRADQAGTCPARKRVYSIIPENTGDGVDALMYTGKFKAAGEIENGTCTSTDNWNTCTFAKETV